MDVLGPGTVSVGGVVTRLRTGRPNRERCLRTMRRMLISVRRICGRRPRFRGTGLVRHLMRPRHVVAFHMP